MIADLISSILLFLAAMASAAIAGDHFAVIEFRRLDTDRKWHRKVAWFFVGIAVMLFVISVLTARIYVKGL